MNKQSLLAKTYAFIAVTLVHVGALCAVFQFSGSKQDIPEPIRPVLFAKLVSNSKPLATVSPESKPAPSPKPKPRSEQTVKPKIKPKMERKPKPEPKAEPKPEFITQPEPVIELADTDDLAIRRNQVEDANKLQETLVQPPRIDAKGDGNQPPAYPVLSKRLKEEGMVLLKVRILIDGSVTDIRIHQSSGYARLDEAAHNAIKRWRYRPAYINGQATDYDYVQPIEFKLR